VVIAMMRRPREELYFAWSGNGTAPVVERVGDVVAPRKVEAVIYEAEEAARCI
jgi:hypothetical protein